MTPPPSPQDTAATRLLIERTVILGLLAALSVGVFRLLMPFATALLFGGTLAIAAWPLRQRLVHHGMRGGSAASLLLVASVLLVLLPVLAMIPSLSAQVTRGIQLAQDYVATNPPAPALLHRIPVVGEQVVNFWDRLAHGHGDLRGMILPYAEPIRSFVLSAAQALADSVLQLLMSLIVATMIWARGDAAAAGLRDILGRLAGPAAMRAAVVASGAVRGVAYGVVGTAVLQGVLMALGLLVAGVPGAALLGFLTLLMAISQLGAVLMIFIWGGAAWWLFDGGSTGWAVFMAGWGLFVGTLDNFVRPWLISFGADMPMGLIIIGVFGGFLSFGFLGLFIGPSLLGVMYVLLEAWRDGGAAGAEPQS